MDREERNKIVEENMGLIYHIIHRNFAYVEQFEFDELVNVGVIGLIKAVNYFKPEYGCKLSTYACPMIDGEIRRFIRDKSEGIKFSRGVKEIYFQINKHKLLDYSPESIAKKLELPIAIVIEALEYGNYRNLDSLDREISIDNGPGQVGDYIPCETDFEIGILMYEIKKILKKREIQVVEMSMRGISQTEIAAKLNLTQASISRDLRKAKNKIIRYFRESGEIGA